MRWAEEERAEGGNKKEKKDGGIKKRREPNKSLGHPISYTSISRNRRRTGRIIILHVCSNEDAVRKDRGKREEEKKETNITKMKKSNSSSSSG